MYGEFDVAAKEQINSHQISLTMQNKLMQTALFWFGTVMAAAFLCCGFLFLLSDVLIENFPQPNRKWLGILFIVYASYRGVRQYNLFKKLKRNENEEQ